MKQIKLTIKQNLLWSSAGSVFYLGTQWLITVLVTRLSGYKDAGDLSLAMAITNLFFCIASYGIRNYQVSDVDNKYGSVIYVKSRYLTALAAFILCSLFIFANRYSLELSIIILAYMIFKATEAIIDVYHGIDQRLFRMDIMGKSFFLRGFATLGLFLILFIFSRNLTLGITGIIIGTLLVTVFYDIPYSHLIDGSLSENVNQKAVIAKIWVLLKECSPLVIYLFLSASIVSIPRYILEHLTDNERLGIYSSIAAPAVLVQVAASYIFNPFIVLFAQAYAERNRQLFVSLYLKCLGYISIMSVIVLLSAYLFGDWALVKIFGADILQHAYLLIPLILCTIATAFVWFLSALLIVMRSLSALIISYTISLLVCIVLSIILINRYDMQGVNIAILTSTILQIIFLQTVGMKKFNRETKIVQP